MSTTQQQYPPTIQPRYWCLVAVTIMDMKNYSARWWIEVILACFRIVSQYYDRMGKIKNKSDKTGLLGQASNPGYI